MRRRKRSALRGLIPVALCISVIGGVLLYRQYAPSREAADLQAWFGVSGDEVALVLDHQLDEEASGRVIGGQTYFPLTWVNEHLNEKFYWDDQKKQLIYTLPESIVYADEETLGNDGNPLLIQQEDEVWLLSGLVQTYTDIRVDAFTEDEVKRAVIGTSWESEQVARVKRNTPVRVRGGVKSPILTTAQKDSQVIVLEQMDSWSKVQTPDGYLGYVQNRRLDELTERPLVSTFDAPEYTSISLDEPICMVWHQVTTPKANQAMETLMADTKGVNVIAPTWFMLTDNKGSYDSLADRNYVKRAHEMGLQVWAVLDNFNRGDQVQSEILFADSDARASLIASLTEEMLAYEIDGINLDIEGIKPSAGPHYVQFIRELSVACRKNGLVLSVDNYVPSAYTSFYNRAEQGRVVDYVVIMGYDEHYAGGEKGSVASIGYEKNGIEDTLEVVPKEKVISGIPFFTRLWEETDSGVTSTAMGISKAAAWVEENGMQLTWDEELGQYYGELQGEQSSYYLWMEEETSIARKMELIDAYELAGVACWKLGFEPAAIWDVVAPDGE